MMVRVRKTKCKGETERREGKRKRGKKEVGGERKKVMKRVNMTHGSM